MEAIKVFLNNGYTAYLRLQKSKRWFKWAENAQKEQKFIWGTLKSLSLTVSACGTRLELQAMEVAVHREFPLAPGALLLPLIFALCEQQLEERKLLEVPVKES